jgi:hypothetical protein
MRGMPRDAIMGVEASLLSSSYTESCKDDVLSCADVEKFYVNVCAHSKGIAERYQH